MGIDAPDPFFGVILCLDSDDNDLFRCRCPFRKRIQQMEQQLSSLTAAIINSDLNLHKPGTINSFMMDNAHPPWDVK